ncbi:MAG: BON domain-containing protein [Desulfobacteraceae bacterium]|nr:BON domain-containing protein [Desulfobacteraceae bacterium]
MKRSAAYLLSMVIFFVSASASADAPPTDAAISQWVNTAIKLDPRMGTGDITASTTNGVVTLFGNADNLVERHFAALEAKKIKGVRAIINRIQLNRIRRPDTDIANLVRDRILTSGTLTAGQIGVAVHGGEVMLTGKAQSNAQKQAAGVLAGEVSGVVAVNNQIMVDDPSTRPDAQILKDVQTNLRLDVYLAEEPIQASVKNGVVTLEGFVSSPYLIERARADVYIIRNVVDLRNQLQVDWEKKYTGREHEITPPDFELVRAIEDVLLLDQRMLLSDHITVQARQGHVTLQGTVPNYRQHDLAGRDAGQVVGVAWVTNSIQVTAAPRPDPAISHDIWANLQNDRILHGDAIKVQVLAGKVQLQGSVPSYFDKAQAEADAARVPGILAIDNALVVHPQIAIDDQALKEHILARIAGNWAISPVLKNITVTLEDGRAVLKGQVRTWQQRREAGRMAILTRGVLAIDNRLTVQGVNYHWDNWYDEKANALYYNPNGERDRDLNPAADRWE